MATLPTAEDYIQAAKREGLARPTRLTREIMETPGSQVNIAFAAVGAMSERASTYAQRELNETRLRTALSVSIEALERYGASELGGEIRQGATSSIVPLTFKRDPGGSSIVIAAGTLVSTNGGVTFETAVDLPLGFGVTGDTVDAIATTAGPGGNVPALTISTILGQVPDTTLAVNNNEPASGGLVEQSPEDYQAQLETAYQRARRGTLGAIEAAAAAVPGIISAQAEELLDGDAQTGRVRVRVLGGGGTTNSSLANKVRKVLREYRCAGIPVIVEALNPQTVFIEAYNLVVDPDFDEATVLEQARSTAVAVIGDPTAGITGEVEVGATLYLAQITGAWQDIDGLSVPQGAIVVPAGDVVPSASSYLVTSADVVQVSTDPAP